MSKNQQDMNHSPTIITVQHAIES